MGIKMRPEPLPLCPRFAPLLWALTWAPPKTKVRRTGTPFSACSNPQSVTAVIWTSSLVGLIWSQ
jgi:hypothetical protein